MRTQWTLAVAAMVALSNIGCHAEGDVQTPNSFTSDQDAAAYNPTYAEAGAQPPVVADAAPAEAAAPINAVLDLAAQELLKNALKLSADKHAKWMKPEGQMMAQTLSEGQTMEQNLMLTPGKCYTVVALGMPAVQEVDIQMLPIAPLPPIPIAIDQTTGPEAAMAPQPNCYKQMLMAVPVRIVVKATKGTGPVGAQIYMK